MTDQPIKAAIQFEKPDGSFGSLPCMFSPASVSFSRKNSFKNGARGSKLDAPMQLFEGEDSGSFDFDLVFDTTDKGTSVRDDTAKVADLMDIKDFSGIKRPPFVRLIWGEQMSTFLAFIDSFDCDYIYFGADGMPLRAEVKLSFTQAMGEANWGKQNPTSGTPEPHSRHRVQVGETLDRIAARHYGDATRWRVIADANGVTDPLAIRPGRMLTIPQL